MNLMIEVTRRAKPMRTFDYPAVPPFEVTRAGDSRTALMEINLLLPPVPGGESGPTAEPERGRAMLTRKAKGYLYVPSEGVPLVVFVQEHGKVAVPVAIRASDRRLNGRAAAVTSAAEGAPPGLYLARVVVAGPGFRVERGPATLGPSEEIRRQAARAQRRARPPHRARALARALLAHVLPIFTGTGMFLA